MDAAGTAGNVWHGTVLKKIFSSQVQVGMTLPCDIYNEKGVLLWAAGSIVKNERQAAKLAKHGYRSELEEWILGKTIPKVSGENAKDGTGRVQKTYIYATVLDALLEIELPLNYIFDVFKADSFFKEKRDLTAQINAIVDLIMDVVTKHESEAIGTMHMYRQSKYTVLNAIYNAIVSIVICRAIGVKEKYQRIIAGAALTANGSIVKLTETLCTQQRPMSKEQRQEMKSHPENSLMLLTRAGIRDGMWLDSVYMHHELMDGSGYPRGIKDEEISVGAKILAVSDSYVSMILPKQVMQQAVPPPTALIRLFQKNAKTLDVKIMGKLIRRMGMYPPGTFVSLKDGGIGVVLDDENNNPLIAKVGDKITNFYSDFSLAAHFSISEIIATPSQLPKKFYKLWALAAGTSS